MDMLTHVMISDMDVLGTFKEKRLAQNSKIKYITTSLIASVSMYEGRV